MPVLAPLVVPALFSAACGDGRTPSLSSLTFEGTSPESSVVLLLSAAFQDDDGDLATCSAAQAQTNERCVLNTFINGRPTGSGPIKLVPLFVEEGIAENATSGTLRFALELSFDGPAPASGSTFTLGARASDAAQNTSTTQEIKLRLENE